MPLFRLAWIPFVINVSMNYQSTALFVVFAVMVVSSLAADGINWFMLRRRARVTPTV